jgi:hypothetical protein
MATDLFLEAVRRHLFFLLTVAPLTAGGAGLGLLLTLWMGALPSFFLLAVESALGMLLFGLAYMFWRIRSLWVPLLVAIFGPLLVIIALEPFEEMTIRVYRLQGLAVVLLVFSILLLVTKPHLYRSFAISDLRRDSLDEVP